MDQQPNHAAFHEHEITKFKESILSQIENAKDAVTQSLEKIKIDVNQQILTFEASLNTIISSFNASPVNSQAGKQNENHIQCTSLPEVLPLDLSNKSRPDSNNNEVQAPSNTEVLPMDIDNTQADSKSSVFTQNPISSPKARSDQSDHIVRKSIPSKEAVSQKTVQHSPTQTPKLEKKYKIPKVSSKLTTTEANKDKIRSKARSRSRSRSPVTVSQTPTNSVEANQRSKIKIESPKPATASTSSRAEPTKVVNNSSTSSSVQAMPFGYHKYLTVHINCDNVNCSETFKSLHELNVHMLSEHKSYMNKCPLRACTAEGFESL